MYWILNLTLALDLVICGQAERQTDIRTEGRSDIQIDGRTDG